ncbi:MAG: thiamine phosphate synthase [Chloroflexota bacterium]
MKPSRQERYKLIPDNLLRMVDANLNRIGEGLRFLEDTARLLLNDAALTRQLKEMRHELVEGGWQFQQRLLQARDSEGDVGAGPEETGENRQEGLPVALVANARRVQEALRVVEELAKAPGTGLDPGKFKRARFSLYAVERTLLSRLLCRDRAKGVAGLYVVVDTTALKGRRHADVTEQAIRGGAKVIQLRDKFLGKRELLPIAQELKEVCAGHNVLFIMNDYLDVALAVGADGLHVGLDDLPVKTARRLLPIDTLLGATVHTVEQAVEAQADGADHIAVSAIYPTGSKETEEVVVGLERLHQVRQAVDLPLVAIGGIKQENVEQVMAAGADAVAVISAVLGADNVETAARQLSDRIRSESNG